MRVIDAEKLEAICRESADSLRASKNPWATLLDGLATAFGAAAADLPTPARPVDGFDNKPNFRGQFGEQLPAAPAQEPAAEQGRPDTGGAEPVAKGCPHYWNTHDQACLLPDGHDGEHKFARREFVHSVPSHCDRIAWRSRYYSLANLVPAPAVPAPEQARPEKERGDPQGGDACTRAYERGRKAGRESLLREAVTPPSVAPGIPDLVVTRNGVPVADQKQGLRDFMEQAQAAPPVASAMTRQPRFFMDHGAIHDRVSGRHMHADNDLEPLAIEHLFKVLTELDAQSAPTLGREQMTREQATDLLNKHCPTPIGEIRHVGSWTLDAIIAADSAAEQRGYADGFAAGVRTDAACAHLLQIIDGIPRCTYQYEGGGDHRCTLDEGHAGVHRFIAPPAADLGKP